ncbi:MAG: hypothetical protein KBS99_08355 [Prevotellaceae bacterium]|nr:hypothetical protein [Candidatus Colivivens caballi]
MKKNIITTVVAFVIALVANAQSTSIYYTPVGETMEIGFGFNPQSHKFVLSVIEESKDDVDFNVDITNAFGMGIMSNVFNEGQITEIPKTKKVSYYECNYELSLQDLNFLLFNASHNGSVNINGTELDGKSLLNAFQSVMRP